MIILIIPAIFLIASYLTVEQVLPCYGKGAVVVNTVLAVVTVVVLCIAIALK